MASSREFPIGRHPGARWVKTDLQVHTIRDQNWKGSPALEGGDPAKEAARAQWAEHYVKLCVAKGLSVIAVTDHHDFVAVPYIQAAAKALPPETPLIVFPGTELSCKDAIQCLVLFDPCSEPSLWKALFGGVITSVSGDGHCPRAATAPNPDHQGCGLSLQDVMKAIDAHPLLRASTMVLPHIGKSGAHKTALRNGLGYRLSDFEFYAGYCEHDYGDYHLADLDKLNGKNEAWSRVPLPAITTGDNRTHDGAALGAHPTWIRLGEPTLEGLRQSALAAKARIAYASPVAPPLEIKSVAVSSALTGPDFILSFNDGYTALIGGRGSGKSALLEYMRFGIGRSVIDLHADDDDHDYDREKRLIEETLGEGFVSVTLSINGVEEVWTRSLSDRETIHIARGGAEDTISAKDARLRFEAPAYSQKELSTLGVADQAEDLRITKIAAADFEAKKQEIERARARDAHDVEDKVRVLCEYQRRQSEHEKAKRRIADHDAQIARLKKELSDKGLSDADKAVLDRRPKMEGVNRGFGAARRWIEEAKSALDHASAPFRNDGKTLWTETDVFPAVKDIDQRRAAASAAARAAMAGAAADVTAFESFLDEKRAEFQLLESAYQAEHDAVSERADANKALIARIRELEEARSDALEELDILEKRVAELDHAGDDFKKAYGRFRGTVAKQMELLAEAAQRVMENSGGLIRAERRIPAVPRNLVAALKAVGDKCGVRGLQEKNEAFAADLADDDAFAMFVENALKALHLKMRIGDETAVGDDIAQILAQWFGLDKLTTGQAQKVLANINEATISAVITARPEPYIRFDYRDGETYIDFANASPGQQAAALLDLLLKQESGPLIIDQPEEDLDNTRIMQIAADLQLCKGRRQIIFATHNANILVNGDADKIVCLAANGSKKGEGARIAVECDGVIETPEVREIITDRMEGGAAAFQLRARKYGV